MITTVVKRDEAKVSDELFLLRFGLHERDKEPIDLN
jgi:hypothetical protein